MNFKLFKLNLKIGWLKLTGKLKKISENNNFSSISTDSPHILIILPIDRDLISKSMTCISNIVDSLKGKNPKFSFIINNKIENKINFYNIETLTFDIGKNRSVKNSKKILEKIYFEKYDIVIDLNIHFSFPISMLVNELRSKYKIGFVSDYSDLFYNIQLQTDKDNITYDSVEYLLGKI
tara:strand:- start:232 stop:768 length:537 start_codon:yes stop_codon:yes gene_type:complete